MNIKTFIDRPVLSGVISMLLLLLGVIGLYFLPVEQFPEIAPPTIRVSATYTGGSADTVQKSVVVPLEEAINGVENMLYMTSSATNNGTATVTVFFRKGTDPDMAMVNVQNRIATAQGALPSEVVRSGITVRKSQASTVKIISLSSPNDSYDQNFLSNYFKINIEPQLARIPGVGELTIFGSDYSMRIWLNPDKMAQYQLVPSDIADVLEEQNTEVPTGTLGADSENTFQYLLKYRGRYEREEDFGEMVIKSLPNGSVLRLKDIAEIELGSSSYARVNELAGHPGVNCMIAQTSGSNANEIIKEVDKVITDISVNLPKGIELVDLMSVKDFLDASIGDLTITLAEAVLLVVLVVYVFLQNLRSTFIPCVAIAVSLMGTFAFLYVAGFSINLLTLFALVLVIGTVVDDAIVVVEAVQAKFDEGYTSSYLAAVDGMKGITSALITTSLVFMAVFIPVCLTGGVTGTFYIQFGLTMAVAVLISTVNALTLSPALCALIMTPRHMEAAQEKGGFCCRFHKAFDTAFSRIAARYRRGVFFLFKRKWMVAVLLLAALVGFSALLTTTKTGLVPDEDTGTITVDVQAAPGSSLAQTGKIMDRIETRIKNVPQIQIYSKSMGTSLLGGEGASNGTFIIRLKPWDQRRGAQDGNKAVINRIYELTEDITEARIMIFAQPMIAGYGVSNGFEVHVQDRSGGNVEDLLTHTRQFMDTLSRRPEIARAQTSFDTKFPQYMVEVDAARCKRNGVSPSDLLNTLSTYIGGNYSSDMNRFAKLYKVMIQASPEHRLDTDSLNHIFVRTASGRMSPIGQYLKLTKVYGASSLFRFNLFPSIAVNGMSAAGYSSGQALEAIREAAAETLPNGYGYELGGMTREEASAENSAVFVFVICIVFIYLILCALYESLIIPAAVILAVPFGLAGSFLFARLFGVENNIYMQTGVIMLIGLLSKTAILLTEYASGKRRCGMSIPQAALAAARMRLRPILMTSLTMIFGLLPMAFATGAGANGSISLGVGTVGGMLVGTLSLLFVVPVLFIVFQSLEERIMPKGRNHEHPHSNHP